MFDFRINHFQKVGTQCHLDTPSGVSFFIDIDPEMRKGSVVIYSHTAYKGVMEHNSTVIYEGVKVKVFNVNC